MASVLMILAPLLALGVVVVLARGIFSMGRSGESSARFSNRMMRWRVILQFLALIAFMGLYALMSRG